MCVCVYVSAHVFCFIFRGQGELEPFVFSSLTSLHVIAAVTAQTEPEHGDQGSALGSLQGRLTGRCKVQASLPGLSSAS